MYLSAFSAAPCILFDIIKSYRILGWLHLSLALLTFFMKSSTPMSSCPLIVLIISTANLALIRYSSNGATEDWWFLCSLIIFSFLIRCLSIAALSSNSSCLTSSLSSVICPSSVYSSAEYPNPLAIFRISSILLSFSIFNASILSWHG